MIRLLLVLATACACSTSQLPIGGGGEPAPQTKAVSQIDIEKLVVASEVLERVRALYRWRYASATMIDHGFHYAPNGGLALSYDADHLRRKVSELTRSGHFSPSFLERYQTYFGAIAEQFGPHKSLPTPIAELPVYESLQKDPYAHCGLQFGVFDGLELQSLEVLRATEEEIAVEVSCQACPLPSGVSLEEHLANGYRMQLVRTLGPQPSDWLIDRMEGFEF